MDIRQKASITAISLALVLASSKFIIGFISNSMTVVSSGLDSLLDVFMSAMNFFAIRKASEPADESHQYGHGKVENLAQVIQAAVILASGSLIIYRSIHEFLHDEPIHYSVFDGGVMFMSLAFTFIITITLKRVAAKTDSDTLRADAAHYSSDIYSNMSALLAMGLSFYTGKTFFDIFFAVIAGCIIIYSAIGILKNGLRGLMDSSIPDSVRVEIEQTISQLPYPYAGYHKLRTRFSGSSKYVDFHLLICRKLNIDEAHSLASDLESTIKGKVRTVDVIIHVEPCDVENCDLTDDHCTVLKLRAARA